MKPPRRKTDRDDDDLNPERSRTMTVANVVEILEHVVEILDHLEQVEPEIKIGQSKRTTA